MDKAAAENRKILYCDEINFTKLSILRQEYSARWTNLGVDQEQIYQGYRSVIVTVSAEQGLEQYDIYDLAIDQQDFIDHLEQLRKKNGTRPLALYLDQLNVHKGKYVRPFYESLNILPIFNIGYSPELNPIEACFS